MTEYRYSHSLNIKTLAAAFISLLVAGIFCFSVYSIGKLGIEKYYMSAESIAARKAEIYTQFSSYVRTNKVNGFDSAAIAKWADSNNYYSVLVLKESQLQYRASKGQIEYANSMDAYTMQQYLHSYGRLYTMKFNDGEYQIAILDSSENRELTILTVIALSSSVFIFIFGIIIYMQHETQRIVDLAKQAYYVSMGDLDAPLRIQGHDEISVLAGEIDNMRDNIIQRMENEHRAYDSSKELITAISHDIRTPMTSVIGYLGILDDSSLTEDPERSSQLIRAAYAKALDLKDLTDELFSYFLVFGKSDPKMEKESYSADILFGQLLAEMQFELLDFGFNVENTFYAGEYKVDADPKFLKRVTNNLVSNIKKYADKHFPITVSCNVENGVLNIDIANTVISEENRVESTKIGVRTCERVMSLMGGSFTTFLDAEKQIFTARVSIRVYS